LNDAQSTRRKFCGKFCGIGRTSLAVLLAVSTKANFERDQVAAWIFGAYAIPGLLSVATSYLYRQPSGIAWSIPGAILIRPALDHFTFAEVSGPISLPR
jgi:benzoate membrane transport protein